MFFSRLPPSRAVHLDLGIGGGEGRTLGRQGSKNRPGVAEHSARRRCSRAARSSAVTGAIPIRSSGTARRKVQPSVGARIEHRSGVPVHARVEVALPGLDAEVEGRKPARRHRERRQLAPLHPAVEDDAAVGAALVRLQELDDRLSADLLLAVRDDAG